MKVCTYFFLVFQRVLRSQVEAEQVGGGQVQDDGDPGAWHSEQVVEQITSHQEVSSGEWPLWEDLDTVNLQHLAPRVLQPVVVLLLPPKLPISHDLLIYRG